MNPAVLGVRGLKAVLGGRTVLDVPLLDVSAGELLVIGGPNGSGKTTLLLCMALLLKPAAGAVLYRGKSIASRAGELDVRRRLGVVLQEPLLLDMSVRDNVALGLKLRGVPAHARWDRARAWMERFGIAALASRQARGLSGGEARRASLARAFALEPEVLLLDEPFSALDATTRQELTEDLSDVLRDTGTTTVMVTHDREEAFAMGDRLAVLIEGRLRQVGRCHDVFSRPADDDVAAFTGTGNAFPGTVVESLLGIATIEVDAHRLDAVSGLAPGSRVSAYIRPDDVVISLPSHSAAPTSARNNLRGVVVSATELTSQVRVTVDCGLRFVSLITRRSWRELGLHQGSEVSLSFKASAVHLAPRR